MPIIIDAVSRGSRTGTFIEQNHPTAGDERLILGILGNDTSSDIVTGMTYGGVAMTRIGGSIGSNRSFYVYSLRHPPLGNNLLRANLAGSNDVALVGLSFNGAVPGGSSTTGTGSSNLITVSRGVPDGGIRISIAIINMNASGDPIATIAIGEVEQAQIEHVNLKLLVGTTDHADPAPEWTLDNSASWRVQGRDVIPAFINLEAVPSVTAFGGEAALTNAARFTGSANIVMTSSGLATVSKRLASVVFVPFATSQSDTVDFFEPHETRRGRSR